MFALAATVCHAISGQPGTLDPFWATASPLGAGKVITPVGSISSYAFALVLQPDGKLVLAGNCNNGANDEFCAMRYLANGTPDTNFGSEGKVITPTGPGAALAIALQPDGKVVLAGYCSDGTTAEFCALRYLANGTLDPSFGSDGKVTSPASSGEDGSFAVILQPDGKLVLAGYCSTGTNNQFCARRYLANGTPDPDFGSGGTVITPVGPNDSMARALALQADGKVVLAGSCSGADFCALRYLTSGTLDPDFGTGGKVITPSAGTAFALALQPDGKLVLAGYCYNGANDNFCALRYHANGTLDLSFGDAGRVITAFGPSSSYAAALTLQPDGKLVLSGYCNIGINRDFCALRYLANGTLDPSFGSGGKVITPVGAGNDVARAIALQPDGKLVLAGGCALASSSHFCALRYDGGPFGYNQCSLDVDGDNVILPLTDALIHLRIALGFSGNAVVSGIPFPPTATRTTWPAIRTFLVAQCGLSLTQ